VRVVDVDVVGSVGGRANVTAYDLGLATDVSLKTSAPSGPFISLKKVVPSWLTSTSTTSGLVVPVASRFRKSVASRYCQHSSPPDAGEVFVSSAES
jgi:hypothetical protein